MMAYLTGTIILCVLRIDTVSKNDGFIVSTEQWIGLTLVYLTVANLL
jgi:hypothetical protein